MNDFAMRMECDPLNLLAVKIVEQAVLDYRSIVRGKHIDKCNTEELELFFFGDWCEFLLSGTDVDRWWVIDQLEKETGEIAQKDTGIRLLTVDGRTDTVNRWCRALGLSKSCVNSRYRKFGRRNVERFLSEVKREKGL